MLEQQAKDFIKSNFRGFQADIDNDWYETTGFYVRVWSNKDHSQYLIKGSYYNPLIVAVGLAPSGIGYSYIKLTIDQFKDQYLRKSPPKKKK